MCTRRALLIGDGLTLFLMTGVGFLVHGTLDELGRLVLTGGLVVLVWLGVSTSLGLATPEAHDRPRWWLRLLWAMVLTVPLALTLRGLLLGQAVNPMFPVAMSTFSGLGMLVWRGGFRLRCRRS